MNGSKPTVVLTAAWTHKQDEAIDRPRILFWGDAGRGQLAGRELYPPRSVSQTQMSRTTRCEAEHDGCSLYRHR